jgi:hypothetical protein
VQIRRETIKSYQTPIEKDLMMKENKPTIFQQGGKTPFFSSRALKTFN